MPYRPQLSILASLALASVAPAQSLLGTPPAPPENPITAEKAVLGKALFWDEQLSSDGSMACGTCHIPSAGGSDPRIGADAINPGPDGVLGTADDITGSPGVVGADSFGHFEPRGAFGLERQVTGRHSQDFLTAAFFDELFWDGRADDKLRDPDTGAVLIPSGAALENQSLGPILSDVEMADSGRGFAEVVGRLERVAPLALATGIPADVSAALAVDPDYPALFQRAFGSPEITAARIAMALATYQRTLVPDQTPYDAFTLGDPNAMTQQQIDGLNAFESFAICAVCHQPPLFSNGGFHALALRPSAEDPGRAAVTGNPADAGKFKTPSLRNVALRGRFFHNGDPSITTLRDSVAFYDGSGAFDNLDPVLNGFTMAPQTIDDVTAFLEALTDPRVANETYPFDRPTLRSERSAPNPRPTGVGAVAGSAGAAPRAIVEPAPFLGAERFRIGLAGARGGAFAAVRLQLVDLGGLPAPSTLRGLLPAPVATLTAGSGDADGYATWTFDLDGPPSLRGVTLDAQWLVRDPAATGGVARTEIVRFTVE